MTRIVQCANFVGPRSGGLAAALRRLAEGYAAAGHEVVQVLPGRSDREEETPWGRVVRVRAPELPGTGCRVVLEPWRVARVLERLAPDRLEVHDRLTLRGLGTWARRHGVPSLVVSHERLDRVLGQWAPGFVRASALQAAADRSNRALAAAFDAVVCTTAWAAAEFERVGVTPSRVPLGVDLDRFGPWARSEELRRCLAPRGEALLLSVTRLSREKAPWLLVETVRALIERGVPVRLVVAGDGPARAGLERAAAGLPVRFLGFVAARDRLAELLASADVVLAPGPVETFGLAALEALASGTPTVVNAASALPEVVGGAGVAAVGEPGAFADAVVDLLARPAAQRRVAARARAEAYPWSAAVAGFLAVHRVAGPRAVGRGVPASRVSPEQLTRARPPRTAPGSGARLPAAGARRR